jgi:polar amino acid transport system substrate-binding protein
VKSLLVSSVVAAVIAWGVVEWHVGTSRGSSVLAAQGNRDSYLDQVEKSGTIRCGYVNNPPFIVIDPNTHAVSGMMVDLTAKIADIIGWKVDWSGETTYPTIAEDLDRHKFDVFCGGAWPITNTEKRIWWEGPLFYSGVGAYARSEDSRFSTGFDIRMIDDPSYSISVIDGVAVDYVRHMDFPHAKTVSLPNITTYGDMITQVTTGKADMVLIEKEAAEDYMVKNPGKIKRVGAEAPLRLYGMGYEFSYDAPRLRNVFGTAMREALYGGIVDRILDKDETVPGMLYRVKPDVSSH